MMAAAMATPDSPSLEIDKLAAADAVIQRTLSPDQFPRLSEAGYMLAGVEATFAFSLVSGRPLVKGQATCRLEMDCQWCLRRQPVTAGIEFACQLAQSEDQAMRWAEDEHASPSGFVTAVVQGLTFRPAQFLEDELLLQISERVCKDEKCEYRPQVAYEAPSVLADKQETEPETEQETAQNTGPFAGLKDLLADSGNSDRR